MAYDGLDRLTDAGSASFGGDHRRRFTYDVLDSLKSWTLAGVKDHHYYYDPSENRLTNVNTSTGAGIVGLGYDVQGNLQQRNGQGYQFDYGNRLREVTGKEHYRYDGHGRRVLAWSPTQGSILSQYNQSGQLVFQQDQRQGKNIDHVYLAGSLVATREHQYGTGATAVRYQHTDALGSPVAVTNEGGQVLERTQFEPYGAAIGKAIRGVGYTGHVMDAATGLTYMQQRYYDPSIGRFLSVDPVTANSGTGANFNRYWYANNNPYRFLDPDGRLVRKPWGNPFSGRDRQYSEDKCRFCLGEGSRAQRPYDEKLKEAQRKHPQITTQMTDMAFDRFALDNPRSSVTRGREWAWEMEGGVLTPSREGSSGRVAWRVAPGSTQALGHTHGNGDSWYLRYFSADDTAAAKTWGIPVFLANPSGEFRVFVGEMRMNGKAPEGLLRGGAAQGLLLCDDCIPTGD